MANNLLPVFKITLPVLLGYIPLGMAFGFLMTTEGFDWYIVSLFSLIVFAGAIQFLMIRIFSSDFSYLNIVVTTLIVNFRHVFYGLSVFKFLPNYKVQKAYFIHCLTDENYSLLTSTDGICSDNSLRIVFLNHCYWVLGALMGSLLAVNTQGVMQQIAGIDFSLTALFWVLFLEQIKVNKSIKLVMIVSISCLFAILLSMQNFLLVAIITALFLSSL